MTASPHTDMLTAAFREPDAFTVNIWLRSGVEFRNLSMALPPVDATHITVRRQEDPEAGTICITVADISALEVEY